MTIKFGHKTVEHPDVGAEGWHGYRCGHCGREVSGAIVARAKDGNGHVRVLWLQCSVCHDGSVLSDKAGLHPGVPFGPTVEGLPKEVEAAYEEARRCMGVSAYTATEGLCRKILMHVAVEKGAEEGKTFASYIDHLEAQGFVTPPMREWVRLIKDHGNMAQHRLDPPGRERAEGTLVFTAQLLRSIYEMGHIASRFLPRKDDAGA